MSLYTKISKELGFSNKNIEIPKESEIKKLIEKAKNKDVESFKKLFEIVRFAPSNTTKDNILKINTAYSGYLETKDLFE